MFQVVMILTEMKCRCGLQKDECGVCGPVRCTHLEEPSRSSKVCRECRQKERQIIKNLLGRDPYVRRRRRDKWLDLKPLVVPIDYTSRYAELELPAVYVSEWDVVIPIPEVNHAQ